MLESTTIETGLKTKGNIKMIGSIVVALVTISLIFTGVYLGNSQDKPGDAEETGSYDEGFFGSLDALVGGLGESAERGEATKEGRYQEYLKVKESAEEASTRFQEAPRAYQAQPLIVPRAEPKATVSAKPTVATTPIVPPHVPSEEGDTSSGYEDPEPEIDSREGDILFDFGDLGGFDDFDDFGGDY